MPRFGSLFILLILLAAPSFAAMRPKKPAAPPAPSAPPSVSTTTPSVPAVVAASTPPITVVYPVQNYAYPSSRGAWIMGRVVRPKSMFRINGQSVKVHSSGGYLGYLPITPGSFTFHCELDLPEGTTSYDRTILVAQPLKADSTAQTVIDPERMQPSEDVELRADGWLYVQMKGTPGGQAQFQIEGSKRKLPMVESSPSIGIYRGAYQLQPSDAYQSSKIWFYLTGPNKSSTWSTAKGRLTVRADPAVAIVKPNGIPSVRTDRGRAFFMFPPAGTKLLAVGRMGADVQVELSPSLRGWIAGSSLQWQPAGSPPPRAFLDVLRTTLEQETVSVHLGLTDNVPFLIEPGEHDDILNVRLFGTSVSTDWMVYDSTDTFVRQLRWSQADSDEVVVAIELDPQRRLWGWRASWEPGGLRIDLHKAPRLPASGSVMTGRTIILDPGHMPSSPGRVGPTGLIEMNANMSIAKALQQLLLKEKAKPVLTREDDQEIGLAERLKIARDSQGDLFVSIHNNALDDGEDPSQRAHGFQIFYYHPFSIELARAIHRSYVRRIPLPDERLRYGNLLVARMTDMPAVLVESAYLNYPEQETLLTTPSFQKRLAQAILEGIRNFLEAERRRQIQGMPPAKKSR